jgi:phosphoserine phosphatase RsbU/P
MKILIAEDERITRRNLQRHIENWGHEVVAAENGAIAWQLLQEQNIPIVITDWEMPEMNGLALLRKIRERTNSSYIYVILLTSKSEKDDIVEGMEAGADDFLSKPFDKNELRVRVRAGIRIIELEQHLEQRNNEITSANERMKNDLDAAAQLQQSLLPSSSLDIPGVSVCWGYEPCEELGGDILNVIPLDDKHIGFYIADVSGHGVPAALLSVTINSVMDAEKGQTTLLMNQETKNSSANIVTPAEVAVKLNNQFQMEKLNGRYFTLCYGVLDIETLEFQYVPAGHPPILKVSRDGIIEELPGRNLAIGWFPEATYEQETVQLEKGDRLYLYSDGIPEAMNNESKQFSDKRLQEFLVNKSKKPLKQNVAELIEAVLEWSPLSHPKDDVSILAIEIKSI